VPRPAQNVIPLHATRALHAKAAADNLPISLHRLGVTAKEFDELRRCLERIVREPRWSAMEWKAACSPLLLRLPMIRQSLDDLGRIRVGRWPDTSWAVHLRAAQSEFERRLMDVRISMSALAGEETSSVDAVVTFSSDAMLLAGAAHELCGLIASRYPAAAAVDGI
jgi:hypothetical protein